MNITKNVFPYVVLGVSIGALIHGFVPASLVEKYLSFKAWWTIPLATLLGAPLYANSVGVIPTNDQKDDNKIMDILQKGYKMGDKVIRHPKVRIGEYKKES